MSDLARVPQATGECLVESNVHRAMFFKREISCTGADTEHAEAVQIAIDLACCIHRRRGEAHRIHVVNELLNQLTTGRTSHRNDLGERATRQSACSPEANDNQSDSGAPPDEVANPTLQGREEAAGGTGAASSLGVASGDAPSKSSGGESSHLSTGGAESLVCATEERFEDLSELPPELAPHLLRTTSLDVDGITRSFYLCSWVEDDGLFLWFATEGDDTHNLLLDTESGAWSLIEGEAHEPRVALAGQFLAFEKDDLDVDLSVGHRFDPESST